MFYAVKPRRMFHMKRKANAIPAIHGLHKSPWVSETAAPLSGGGRAGKRMAGDGCSGASLLVIVFGDDVHLAAPADRRRRLEQHADMEKAKEFGYIFERFRRGAAQAVLDLRH